MKAARFKIAFSLAFLLISNAPSFSEAEQEDPGSGPNLDKFFQKSQVTIAVTDSGLGGLSVMAEAARRMKEAGIFETVNFIFYNALFSTEGGYNSLKTRKEKIAVFSSALESLGKNFRPDLILIGCNTLSVLYEDTPFSESTKIPVVGIVEAGVEMIAQSLRTEPDSSVIIFGTPTTISEGMYQQKLEGLGFSAKRVFVQPCPELESYIERDYEGDETEMLIAACLDEACQKIPSPAPPLYISLNCTHYGYSLPFWEKAFREAGFQPLAILNPNFKMIGFLFPQGLLNRFSKTEVGVRVVSMVEIDREKIASLARWFQNVSPETSEALARYEHNSSLFEWKKFVSR